MLFLPNQCICVCANCHRKIHANKLKPLNAAIDYNSLIDIANEIKNVFPWKQVKTTRKKPKVLKNQCLVCNKSTNNKFYCSDECCKIAQRKVIRPTLEQLQKDLTQFSMVCIGRKYGVSDNTIRKWIKKYEKEIDSDGTRTHNLQINVPL